jgi:Flp pilus assembly protein TadD
LAADTLARALYQNGKYAEAQTYSEKALRLGTRDATFHFHAGMIAAALGDKAKAREHLNLALSINPNFSLLYAPEAQAKLKELGQ